MGAILYDKTGEVKLGNLVDILEDSYEVEEERNGIFDLVFDYPNSYPLADQLIEENFVEVKPNDEQGNQKFRIYSTKKLIDDIITVFARHESFDLANDHVENINLPNASCEYALNTLFRNSHFSKDFRGYSDIVNAQDYKIDNVNILNAIAGKEGSIIDTYGTGAEILRDGKNIHVLNKRGHDNGVTIEYGKNLTGFELAVDLEGLETRCGGFAKYKPSGSEEEIIIRSDWIDSPFIDNFSHPYINVGGRRDYSDKFKDGVIPTKEVLNKLCQDEFKINKRDIPSSNYKINFIPLSKCVGYEGIEDKISLCDTVTIIDPRFNINTKAKVIKYKYDFIKERYISMELGEPRTTLGDIIGNGGKGEQGPPGPPGKDGADGNIGDFPNSLPVIPILTATVKGFDSIDLSWTYEDKVYYTYEVYASKTRDFTPNTFDLIHEGQTSSFLFKAKPGETWYFRVCAKNTHGDRTDFSPQVTVTTSKADNFDEYFSNLAVGNLVTNIFSSDYMEAGIIKGNWIDARNLSVTNGNGKRTVDVDSFGDITLMPRVLKVLVDGREENVATQSQLSQTSEEIKIEMQSQQNNDNLIRNAWNLAGLRNFSYFKWDAGETDKPCKGVLEGVTSHPWVPKNQTCMMITNIGGAGNSHWHGATQRVKVTPGSSYTFSCYAAAHRIRKIAIEIKRADNSQHISTKGFTGIKPSKERTATFEDDFSFLTLTFFVPTDCSEIDIYVQSVGKLDESASVTWIARWQLEKGHEATNRRLNVNEVNSMTATFDVDGLEMKHSDGSKTQITPSKVEFTDREGNPSLRVKDGGLNFFTWGAVQEMVGFMKPAYLTQSTLNGVSLSTYNDGEFISIGHSTSVDETSWISKPYMMAINRDYSNFKRGLNFPANYPVHSFTKFHAWDHLIVEKNNLFVCENGSDYSHLLYNSTHGNFCVMGNQALIIGVRDKGKNMTKISVSEIDPIHSYSDWDFHGWTMRNMRNTMSLEPINQFEAVNTNMRLGENYDASTIYSYNDNEIRYTHKESIKILGENKAIIEIPTVVAENMENDYHLNIGKISWGDYRVLEKNPYYFEIEVSSTPFEFTYEVVGTIKNKYANILPTNVQYLKENLVEEQSIPEQVEHKPFTYEQSVDKLPLWVRYKKQD